MIDIKSPNPGLFIKDFEEVKSYFYRVVNIKRVFEIKTIKYNLNEFYKYLKSIGINNLTLQELFPYGVVSYRIYFQENVIELVIRKELND